MEWDIFFAVFDSENGLFFAFSAECKNFKEFAPILRPLSGDRGALLLPHVVSYGTHTYLKWTLQLSAPMPDPTFLKKIAKLDSHARFLISLCVAVIVFIVAGQSPVPMVRIIWAWLGGAGTMLLLSIHSMMHAEVHHIKMIAAKQDPGKHVIFALVLIGSCCSLLAIGFLVGGTKGLPREDIAFHLVLAGFTILISWLLIHTIYAFRYAHLF